MTSSTIFLLHLNSWGQWDIPSPSSLSSSTSPEPLSSLSCLWVNFLYFPPLNMTKLIWVNIFDEWRWAFLSLQAFCNPNWARFSSSVPTVLRRLLKTVIFLGLEATPQHRWPSLSADAVRPRHQPVAELAAHSVCFSHFLCFILFILACLEITSLAFV